MDRRFIDECEKEELHLSGAIQPHGALLVMDAHYRISHFSTNAAQLLADDFLVAIDAAMPAPLVDMAGELGERVGSRLQYEAALNGRDGRLDVVLTRNAQGRIIVELTPCCEDPVFPSIATQGVVPPASNDEVEAQRQALIEKVCIHTGFQRVMYYRFLEDGDGEVLAEVRQEGVEGSYLGLRFPASDIPQIARVLYQQNPWRLIPDALATPVPLLGRDDVPPDLSYSDLRSVSPVHAVYLSNMGVGASLSFPIVVGGQLWGLIACHNATPCQVGLGRLSQASQEVRSHTLGLAAYFAQRRMQLLDGLVRRFGEAREIVHEAGDIVAAWPRLGSWLAAEFGADGVQLCLNEGHVDWGEGFEPDALSHIDDWFVSQQIDPVWLAESLSRQLPDCPLSRVAGLLAVKAKTTDGLMLRVYLTRHEHIHDVAWGGNPDKPVERHDGVYGIAPRRSFEKWVEKRLGRSRPWDNEARLLGLKLRELLMQLGRRE
ncbi:MAG: GAF domain-containing protein [Dechloromonas sp.]|nr:GAF domain-containing protein [Dechloromonas sp.]